MTVQPAAWLSPDGRGRSRTIDGAMSVSSATISTTEQVTHGTHVVTGTRSACLHCGEPIRSNASNGWARVLQAGQPEQPAENVQPLRDSFCCIGCQTVYQLLRDEGLQRYYDVRPPSQARPVADVHADEHWLAHTQSQLAERASTELCLDVQGIHCSACVWLIERLFQRQPGAEHIVVNPTLGTAQMIVRAPFSIVELGRTLQKFGYTLGPRSKQESAQSQALLLRMGLCIAFAMNSMIYAFALYLGLREGTLFRLFQSMTFALGVASVWVGGSVFFRSAWAGVRQRVMHLDVPISLGILLAFAGSVYSFCALQGRASYFDTLSIFIALMLVGRFLQERVIEKNRRAILQDDGVENILTLRVEGDRVQLRRCGEIEPGDVLMIAHGDLVPVDGELLAEGGSFALNWISGESEPEHYAQGALVKAGSFSCGSASVLVQARMSFTDSPLMKLLRSPIRAQVGEGDRARVTRWWRTLASWYTAAVLVLASGGFGLWWWVTSDVGKAIEIATAVLIVTCPCAFGIAVPLGYELAQARLRRRGLYIRSASLLDRVPKVRNVVFDKTGTLTTGRLRVTNPEAIGDLDETAKEWLYNMVCRSNHPKAVALRHELARQAIRFLPHMDVREIAGVGLECEVKPGAVATFGSVTSKSLTHTQELADVGFFLNGQLLAKFHTDEELRDGASRDIRGLQDAGFEVYVLSGDTQARTTQLAASCGIPRERAVGGQSPEEKMRWVSRLDEQDTLMIGDGVNDTLAVTHAYCSGTPAVDRPFMATRSDFYFQTAGLAPILDLLQTADALKQVVRRNLAIAIAYNIVAVALCYAGWMSPLLCAVLMPLSSVTTVLWTVWALSARRLAWRS